MGINWNNHVVLAISSSSLSVAGSAIRLKGPCYFSIDYPSCLFQPSPVLRARLERILRDYSKAKHSSLLLRPDSHGDIYHVMAMYDVTEIDNNK